METTVSRRRRNELTARVLAHLGAGCTNLAIVFGAPVDPRIRTGPAGPGDVVRSLVATR